ncbi:hypothetical protein C8N41_10562 [Winogradskyella sediminis]|nr:hypothetical protein C8N41_10562 [Winogradskyella sediminis]
MVKRKNAIMSHLELNLNLTMKILNNLTMTLQPA